MGITATTERITWTGSRRYFDDLSENEVADLLGVSSGTVKSTASRAVAQLRTQPGLIALLTTDTTR
jgi:predicted DNA-binding protein YlxM (UPF0122 family)